MYFSQTPRIIFFDFVCFGEQLIIGVCRGSCDLHLSYDQKHKVWYMCTEACLRMCMHTHLHVCVIGWAGRWIPHSFSHSFVVFSVAVRLSRGALCSACHTSLGSSCRHRHLFHSGWHQSSVWAWQSRMHTQWFRSREPTVPPSGRQLCRKRSQWAYL